MRRAIFGSLLLLTACDKPASKPAPVSSASATAPPVAAATASATPTAPSPPPSGSASAPPARRHQALPAPTFTEGKSKVPTIKEWKDAPIVEIRHARSLWCEAKVVREWLRMSCRSAELSPNQVGRVFHDQNPVGEAYLFNGERVTSAVVAVRPGTDVRLTYTWSKWGDRVLTVKHPKDAAAPQIGFDRGGPKGRDGAPLCDDVCFVPWHHKADITCATPCGEGFRCEVWRDSGELVTVCVCDLECSNIEEKADGTSL